MNHDSYSQFQIHQQLLDLVITTQVTQPVRQGQRDINVEHR